MTAVKNQNKQWPSYQQESFLTPPHFEVDFWCWIGMYDQKVSVILFLNNSLIKTTDYLTFLSCRTVVILQKQQQKHIQKIQIGATWTGIALFWLVKKITW